MPENPRTTMWKPAVLVVDPQQSRRVRITTWFHERGFPVASVPSGPLALEELREAPEGCRPRLLAISVDTHDLRPPNLEDLAPSHPWVKDLRTLYYEDRPEHVAAMTSSPNLLTGIPLGGLVRIDELEEAVRDRVEAIRTLYRLEEARRKITQSR